MYKFRNFVLTIVTAIGVSNTIGYTYLNKNQVNENTVSNNETAEINDTSNSQETPAYSDTPEVDLTSEKSEDSNNKITEKAELKSDKKPDELKESKVTEPSSTDVVVSTENKVEESVPTDKKTNSNDGKEYSIKNIKSNIVYNEKYSRSFWSLDPANDCVYVANYDKERTIGTINKISLSTCESEEGIQADSLKDLIFNPYTGDTFARLTESIFNLRTGEIYENDQHLLYSFIYLRFLDDNLIAGIERIESSYNTNFGSYFTGDELILGGDNNFINSKIGYISWQDYGVDLNFINPFLFNDCYYWIISNDYRGEKYRLIYTLQSVKENKQDLSDDLEEFEAVACTVSNNEVYFMRPDFSVYKLNMELVTEKQNAPITTVPEKNIYSDKTENTETDPIKKYCSLYLDGSKIKQTGKTNLNSVNSFYIRNNGDIVVFDTFDSTIKVIEKNQD